MTKPNFEYMLELAKIEKEYWEKRKKMERKAKQGVGSKPTRSEKVEKKKKEKEEKEGRHYG